MQKVPRIISQSERYLLLMVPSKSNPGLLRHVEYKPNGDRECSCPGAYWFKEKGQDLYKSCRHQKMTTTKKAFGWTKHWPDEGFHDIKEAIKNKEIQIYVTWGLTFCRYPDHRNEDGTHCNSCPLYPKVCNIRKIKTGRGPRARLPLIWRLQGACYNNKRAEARKLINRIIAAIRKYEG